MAYKSAAMRSQKMLESTILNLCTYSLRFLERLRTFPIIKGYEYFKTFQRQGGFGHRLDPGNRTGDREDVVT